MLWPCATCLRDQVVMVGGDDGGSLLLPSLLPYSLHHNRPHPQMVQCCSCHRECSFTMRPLPSGVIKQKAWVLGGILH